MVYLYYSFILFFCFANMFRAQNLPACQNILLKYYFKYVNKNKIIIIEKFFMQVYRVIIRAKILQIYSQMVKCCYFFQIPFHDIINYKYIFSVLPV